ncbi:MAG: hypothetical protein ACKVQS_14800, partial [Fimbriimonadaceae bacterium]
ILTIGFQYFKNIADDPDFGDFKSAGYILAIERIGSSGKAVLFDDTGKRIDAPKPQKTEYDDREVSWSVDGQRIFISSNRDSNAYSVYRWNPDKNKMERRSAGSMSQGAPWFGPYDDPDAKKYGLIQSGGQILALEIRTGATGTVLPPSAERVTTEGEGSTANMEVYNNFGESFIKARFAGGRNRILGVMRNDEGNTVIFQPVGLDQNGQALRPREIYRAKRADIEVDRQGVAVVMLAGFQFPPNAEIPPEFVKNGKVTPPFEDAIFKVSIGEDLTPKVEPVAFIPSTAAETFINCAVSPDGSMIAVVVGTKLESGGYEARGMVVMPFEAQGNNKMRPIIQGAVSSPSWSPDGSKLTYLKTVGSDTDVYRSNADGSSEIKLTNGGNWATPQFSPATGS